MRSKFSTVFLIIAILGGAYFWWSSPKQTSSTQCSLINAAARGLAYFLMREPCARNPLLRHHLALPPPTPAQ